jgi:hypothetical protein
MASAKGMNIVQGKPKKWIAILAILLLIFLVISQPVEMAAFFTSLADGLKQALSALGAFFRALG